MAIRRRRPTPRRSSRIRDASFMGFVHTLPCCAAGIGGHVCTGRIEAHHMGVRGIGQKADDTTCVPLCTGAHRAWHDCNGPFAGWARDERHVFAELTIGATRAAYARSQGDGAIAF